jgi:integrase
MTALRFFFSITLDRYELRKPLFRVEQPRKLPTVLTQEEVARLLDAAASAKYKAALSVAYGAGLRASEVMSLKVSDIDSARMLLRVEQGKGLRTALPCSLRCCSIFCASGTASAGRKAGCFQAGTLSTR